MDDFLATIGSRIRKAREDLGLSQEALASRARLNTSYLSQIERGKKEPSLTVLRRVAAAVNLTLSEVFAGDELDPSTDAQVREIVAALESLPPEKRPTLLLLLRSLTDLASG